MLCLVFPAFHQVPVNTESPVLSPLVFFDKHVLSMNRFTGPFNLDSESWPLNTCLGHIWPCVVKSSQIPYSRSVFAGHHHLFFNSTRTENGSPSIRL